MLADILWCVPHVSPLTLSQTNPQSPYSFISLMWPHTSGSEITALAHAYIQSVYYDLSSF